jgi:hypothetical protein
MRRCDHCDGKLGLVVYRRWRLRFCKLACKNSYQHRQRQDSRHRRRWLDAFGLKPAATAVLRHFSAARDRLGYGILALNLICSNPVEAYFALDSLASTFPENAQARSLGRPSTPHLTNGYLPSAGPKLGSSPFLSSILSVSRLSTSRIGSPLPQLSSADAAILRRASARIAEYFYQRLAPAVEGSLLGDISAGHGISVRLVKDGRVADSSTHC